MTNLAFTVTLREYITGDFTWAAMLPRLWFPPVFFLIKGMRSGSIFRLK